MLKRIVKEEDKLTFDMGNFSITLGNVLLNEDSIDSTVGIIVANRKYLVTKKEEKDGKLIIRVSYFPANYYSYIYLRDYMKKANIEKPVQVFLPKGIVSDLNDIQDVLGEVEDKIYLYQQFIPKKEASNI